MESRIRHPILALAFVCSLAYASAQNPSADAELSEKERSAVLEGAIAKLNEMYVFPDVAKKMEEAIRIARQIRIDHQRREFGQKLKADLR